MEGAIIARSKDDQRSFVLKGHQMFTPKIIILSPQV
jgi:hypothetical protein